MIYVCIPSYNEERTVGVLLWKIRQVLTALGRDFELLLLDDASTDKTQDVLEPYSRVLPLTILKHKERQGYATSIETLLREAVRRSPYPKRDIILTIQADFTEDPEEIPALVKRIEAGADVVTTVQAPREDAPRSLRWSHRAAGYLMKRFGVSETGADALSVLRAYRVYPVRKAVEGAKTSRLMTGDRWAANAMLLRAVRAFARRVDTVEVSLYDERRQRPSRLEAWGSLKQVFGMRRAPAESAAVPHREGVAVLHQPRARAPQTRRPAEPSPDTQRRGGRKQSSERERPRRERPAAGAGEPRRGGKDRPERTDRSERPERPERPPRAERADRPERAPRAPRPAPHLVVMNGSAPVAEAGVPAEQPAKKPGKRRKRGSGRKRRREGNAAQSNEQGQLALSPEAAGPQATAEGISERPPEVSDAVSPAEEGGVEAARQGKRRRGGRRGSRGRRGGRGRNQAPTDATDEAPSASAEPASHAQVEGPHVHPETSEGRSDL